MGRLPGLSLGPFQTFFHPPPFLPAEGPGFDDHHPVSHAATVGFIVDFVAGASANIFLVQGMFDQPLDFFSALGLMSVNCRWAVTILRQDRHRVILPPTERWRQSSQS